MGIIIIYNYISLSWKVCIYFRLKYIIYYYLVVVKFLIWYKGYWFDWLKDVSLRMFMWVIWDLIEINVLFFLGLLYFCNIYYMVI